jgi:transcriptional regulator with XRE-family HTH domain
MSVTIKDVARETGLSIATISKYINGGNVLDENSAKIAPGVIFYLIGQKYFIEGIVMTGMKN